MQCILGPHHWNACPLLVKCYVNFLNCHLVTNSSISAVLSSRVSKLDGLFNAQMSRLDPMDKVRTSGGLSFPGVASLKTGFSGAIPHPGAEETPRRHRARRDVWGSTARAASYSQAENTCRYSCGSGLGEPSWPRGGGSASCRALQITSSPGAQAS